MRNLAIVVFCMTCSLMKSYAEGATSLEITLTAQHSPIVLGEPLAVYVEFRAPSETSIDLGPNRIGNLSFSVVQPSGATKILRIPVPEFTAPGLVKLKAGSTFRERVNLAPGFRPEDTGTYTIQLKLLKNPDLLANGGGVPQESVIVEGPDFERLAQVATDLGKELVAAPGAEERLELGSELASIKSDAAIPAIMSVLGRGFAVDDQLIRDLASIGSSAAVDALRRVATSDNPENASLSRSGLVRIIAETKDSQTAKYARKTLDALR